MRTRAFTFLSFAGIAASVLSATTASAACPPSCPIEGGGVSIPDGVFGGDGGVAVYGLPK